MHSDPSPHLHTEKCNKLVAKLVQCRFEHPYAKFIGYCNDIDFAMTKCFREEKTSKRLENNKRATERLHRVIETRVAKGTEVNAVLKSLPEETTGQTS
ncbi:hypothetical protein RvY_07205 [Ramazzottius varieornatus]|uniref:COX assembly mitochondrial protein n=1 Tax=Ramazzottius varieornatus TaxID=947166 RepID=A0A1D1V4I2_RAMVA|nr:hypothetical protein RvY_07205 [Ramazzottius varieornatus]